MDPNDRLRSGAPLAGGLLTAAEGRALAVLDGLLGVPRRDAPRENVPLEALRQELLEAGAQRIAATAVRWLVESGGHHERRVLRNGRRIRGRVWDPALGEGFHPTFTRATVDLWLGAARSLPGMSVTRADNLTEGLESSGRKNRRVLRDMVTADGTRAGDWIFYALVAEHLDGFTLSPLDRGVLVRKLRLGSPVASLMVPASEDAAALSARLDPLATTAASRIVECAEERIARAWTDCGRTAWEATETPAGIATRWRSLGCTQMAWLSVVDGARRMDLARPVARAARALMTETLRGDGTALWQRIAGTRGLRTVAERDNLLAAVAEAVRPGTVLLTQRDAMAAERYGDDRYEEAQVFIRDVDDLLGPCRREIQGIARALSAEIG